STARSRFHAIAPPALPGRARSPLHASRDATFVLATEGPASFLPTRRERCAQVRLLKTSSTMHLSCRSHRRRGIGGRNAPPRGERVYDPGGETMSTQQQERTEELPVSLGGAPVFVQTSVSPMKELDRWRQMGEEEARAVYEMTLRNELSGGTPVVRE